MAAQPSDRYLGEVILRRYLIDRLVGEGSFAWVYRAQDRDGDTVAVKILHSQAPTAAMRFAREIRVLQALPDTPAVAHYIDHGHSPDGRPTLVLEYVDGITLKLGLERRPTLAPEQAVAFLSDVCEAFDGLHQLGVAHRDVKPENILMARRGGIKLIDFGLIRDAQGILRLLEGEDPLETRVFQDELDRGVLAGTPEYMAPEQFTDSAVHDPTQARTDTWSDVYSLGVIMYELLTGRKPFVMREVPDGEYAQELLRYVRWRLRLRDRDMPRISGITTALHTVVRKALRRDPRRRQPDARALLKDLRHYAQTGQGVQRTDESRTMVASVSNIFAAHAQSRPNTGVSQVSYQLFDDGRSSEPPPPPAPRPQAVSVDAPTGRSSPEPDDAFTGADAYAPTMTASPRYAAALDEEQETPRLDKPKPAQTRDITRPSREAESSPAERAAPDPDEPASLDDTNPRLADELLTRTYSPLSPLEAQRVDSSKEGADLFMEDELAWPEENLADPPNQDDPAILSAPTDAPSLSIDDFFQEWPDDDLSTDLDDRKDDGFADDHFVGDPREVNLADLAPRRRKNR